MKLRNGAFLFGASDIQENVLADNLVQWSFWWAEEKPVIYADDYSIMIFDFQREEVHIIFGFSYQAIPFLKCEREGRMMTVVELEIDQMTGIVAGLVDPQIDNETWTRLMEITFRRPQIRARLQFLRPN